VAFRWLSLNPTSSVPPKAGHLLLRGEGGGKSGERAAKSGKDGKRVMVEKEELLVL
jgi:hypothetical protein